MRTRALGVVAICAVAAALRAGGAARAGATEVPLPIPLDAPTQKACAAPAPTDLTMTISYRPYLLSSLGDYPPANDVVAFVPDTPFFHLLWIDGVVGRLTAAGLVATPGPLARACVHEGAHLTGDVYEAKGLAPGTYIAIVAVRDRPEDASIDGGFVAVGPHARGARPVARFFAQEIDAEVAGDKATLRELHHLALVDEVP